MKKKTIALALVLVMVFGATLGGTFAYLTSQDTVVNTFTVGNVQIKLDEAKVNAYGEAVDANGKTASEVTEGPWAPAPRVKANEYKLLPGHPYNKDPMVTVLKGSESAYIKMTVTFSKAAELDAIFSPDGANLTSIFKGSDSANWIAKGNTKDTGANTRTYEFWYKEAVAAPTEDVALDALFDSITVPGSITNTQLDTIKGMTITVNAYAIQADGFANADAAWAAYAG